MLADLLAEPHAKLIVFSERERMLDMVRELACEMGIEAAWHTGSVPQHRRRAEINRFKQDPQCRLWDKEENCEQLQYLEMRVWWS